MQTTPNLGGLKKQQSFPPDWLCQLGRSSAGFTQTHSCGCIWQEVSWVGRSGVGGLPHGLAVGSKRVEAEPPRPRKAEAREPQGLASATSYWSKSGQPGLKVLVRKWAPSPRGKTGVSKGCTCRHGRGLWLLIYHRFIAEQTILR